MRKYLLFILAFCILPLSAQNSADRLLQNTVSKLKKDGSIAMTLNAAVKNEGTTEHMEMVIRMSGTGFYAQMEDNTLWFDGKTMWNGKDFGDGIEEIYITEPTPEEKARYDIISLIEKHQGFSVSGNGTDTFVLTASNPERSVEGISKVNIKVDAGTYAIQNIQVEFDEGLGGISATAKVTEYKPGQKFDKAVFTCPVKDFKDAEIIDLR